MKKSALLVVVILLAMGCESKQKGIMFPPIPVMTIGETEYYSSRETDSLVFSARAGESNPPIQELYIRSVQNQKFKWSVSKRSSWLSVAPTSGIAPTKLSFFCDIANMPAGIYRDTVVFSSKETSNPTRELQVILRLTPPPVYIDIRPYKILIGEEGFFKEYTDGFRIDYSGMVTINSKTYIIYSTSDTSFTHWLFYQEKLAGFISSVYDTVIFESSLTVFPDSLRTEYLFLVETSFEFEGKTFDFGYYYFIADTNITLITPAGNFNNVLCLRAEFCLWTDDDVPWYSFYKINLAPSVGVVKLEFLYSDLPVREFKSGFVNGTYYGSP